MGQRVIEHPVPLMLRRIFIEKLNGELEIKDDRLEKRLYFMEGKLAFAKTNLVQERLGEILFKIGKINRGQFWDIHKLMEGKREKLGKILVQNNLIQQNDLFQGLIIQARTIAVSTFALTSGEWEFFSQIPELASDSQFHIELPEIFREGIDRLKSLPMFRNQFLEWAPVLKPLGDDVRRALTADDQVLLKELAAYPQMSAEKICARVGPSPDRFWTQLAYLYLLNALDFAELSSDQELNRNIEELITLYDRLKTSEIDYYELLGLNNRADGNDIKDAYFILAKKFHPDRMGKAPDPDLREKANFVFTRINKAYDVLSHEENRREYDTRGYKEMTVDRVSENLFGKANILYRKARTLYNQKRYWEAASLLEEAVRYDKTKASYYLLLGLSQVNILSLKRAAEKSLQRVTELEPWNTEPYVALGMLFLSEKLEKRAEGFFRKALSINPDHPIARKKLEEITGSDKGKGLLGIFKKK